MTQKEFTYQNKGKFDFNNPIINAKPNSKDDYTTPTKGISPSILEELQNLTHKLNEKPSEPTEKPNDPNQTHTQVLNNVVNVNQYSRELEKGIACWEKLFENHKKNFFEHIDEVKKQLKHRIESTIFSQQESKSNTGVSENFLNFVKVFALEEVIFDFIRSNTLSNSELNELDLFLDTLKARIEGDFQRWDLEVKNFLNESSSAKFMFFQSKIYPFSLQRFHDEAIDGALCVIYDDESSLYNQEIHNRLKFAEILNDLISQMTQTKADFIFPRETPFKENIKSLLESFRIYQLPYPEDYFLELFHQLYLPWMQHEKVKLPKLRSFKRDLSNFAIDYSNILQRLFDLLKNNRKVFSEGYNSYTGAYIFGGVINTLLNLKYKSKLRFVEFCQKKDNELRNSGGVMYPHNLAIFAQEFFDSSI